jgi:hypothetical protein
MLHGIREVHARFSRFPLVEDAHGATIHACAMSIDRKKKRATKRHAYYFITTELRTLKCFQAIGVGHRDLGIQ